jgi:hypothetical protein
VQSTYIRVICPPICVSRDSKKTSHVRVPGKEIKSHKNWPTKILCEMNVGEWHLALEQVGLREKYNDVIEGFKHRFHQGIPPHSIDSLQWYTPNELLLNCKKPIRRSLDKQHARSRRQK